MAKPQVLLFNGPFNLLNFNRQTMNISLVTRHWKQDVRFHDAKSASKEFEEYISHLVYNRKTASEDIFSQVSYWVIPNEDLTGISNTICLRKKALEGLIFTQDCLGKIEDRSIQREHIDLHIQLKHAEQAFRIDIPVKSLVELLHFCIYEHIPAFSMVSEDLRRVGQQAGDETRIDIRKYLNLVNIKYPLMTF